MHHQYLLPIGGPCVGKGYNYIQLNSRYSVAKISTGEIIRKLILEDQKFAAEYGPVVSRGDLVPDEIVMPIAREKMDHILRFPTQENRRVYLDGVPRSRSQFEEWVKLGYLTKHNTLVLFLDATRQTCWERCIHRNQNKPGGDRPDEHVFDHRFSVYEQELPEFLKAVKAADFTIVPIDAVQELEDMAKIIGSFAHDFWSRSHRQNHSLPLTPRPVHQMTSRQRILASYISRQGQGWAERSLKQALA